MTDTQARADSEAADHAPPVTEDVSALLGGSADEVIDLHATGDARYLLVKWAAGYVGPAHHHPYADECFYIRRGNGVIELDGEPPSLVRPGAYARAIRGQKHRVLVDHGADFAMLAIIAPNPAADDWMVMDERVNVRAVGA